jgi:hypothetical protein
MSGDVINEGCNAVAQFSFSDDRIYQAHEDLGSILITKGHASILV